MMVMSWKLRGENSKKDMNNINTIDSINRARPGLLDPEKAAYAERGMAEWK